MLNRKILAFLFGANLFMPVASASEMNLVFIIHEGGNDELNNEENEPNYDNIDSFQDLCYTEDNVRDEAQAAGCMSASLFKEQKYLLAINDCCNKTPLLLTYGIDRISMFSYLRCPKSHLFKIKKQGHNYCFLGSISYLSAHLSYFASDRNNNEIIPNDLFDGIFNSYKDLKQIYIRGGNHDLTAADINSINTNERFTANLENDGSVVISKK